MSLTRFPLDQPVTLTLRTFADDAETIPADPTALSLTVLNPDATETTYTWAGGGISRTALGVFTWSATPPSGDYAYHGTATGTVATGLDGRFKVLAKYAIDVTVADLARYLNNPGLDVDRAQLILDETHELCETIVDPLPPRARSVVLDVAERAFANPTATRDEGLGLYSEGVGPFNTSSPGYSGGGLFLTKANKATLRRLNGAGGAFTIDLLPATLPSLPPWDSGNDIAILNLP